jgi:hypothetical protein
MQPPAYLADDLPMTKELHRVLSPKMMKVHRSSARSGPIDVQSTNASTDTWN